MATYEIFIISELEVNLDIRVRQVDTYFLVNFSIENVHEHDVSAITKYFRDWLMERNLVAQVYGIYQGVGEGMTLSIYFESNDDAMIFVLAWQGYSKIEYRLA